MKFINRRYANKSTKRSIVVESSRLPPVGYANDIETGEFELADDTMMATRQLYDRLPDDQPWVIRIGYRCRASIWSAELKRRSMMQGYVNENFEAIISVSVKNGVSFKSIDAVIDTGFTGFLSLPSAIILELGLQWSYRDRATLGDGSETVFDVYNAEIVWNGQLREIEITYGRLRQRCSRDRTIIRYGFTQRISIASRHDRRWVSYDRNVIESQLKSILFQRRYANKRHNNST
jgi:clan AA aspartic protease